MALPALMCALLLARTVWHRIDRVSAPTVVAAEALLEAVESGDVARAHLLIRAGGDANELLPFAHERLTKGRVVTVTPLAVAVARGDENMVRMLLTHGVRGDDPRTGLAPVLAQDMLGKVPRGSDVRPVQNRGTRLRGDIVGMGR